MNSWMYTSESDLVMELQLSFEEIQKRKAKNGLFDVLGDVKRK